MTVGRPVSRNRVNRSSGEIERFFLPLPSFQSWISLFFAPQFGQSPWMKYFSVTRLNVVFAPAET